MVKVNSKSQKGRSMVEMLGVLAIIGVLSVGGVYGYGVAMKKHKANELLQRASMLASTVSAQIMSGKNPTALDTFADSNLGKFTLETYTDGDNTFKLKISDIDGNVCELMKSSMGGIVRDIVCDENAKTALMTFNKDLSTTDLPKTESVIDKNITNPEDCQKAGKTWCAGLNEGQGACSNVKDCCQSVSVDNVCQSCFSVTGEIINRVQASSCDSDGDGSNDGICFPVEQTDESCSGTSLDELCLNGVQFQPSDNMMCVPVSCKALESMNLSQCCYEYELDTLMQAGMDALESGNMSQAYSYIDQAHVAQCTTCDSDTGNTTSLADGTECGYVDLEYYMAKDEILPGICQNGRCVNSCDGFYGDDGICYPCNTTAEVIVNDTRAADVKNKCPNRKFISITHDGDYLCVLGGWNQEPIWQLDTSYGNDVWEFCYSTDRGRPMTPEGCVNSCQNTLFPKKMENGYCVPANTNCPTGYYLTNNHFCIPCDSRLYDDKYHPATYLFNASAENCQKCADDGAHARWMDGPYCRY